MNHLDYGPGSAGSRLVPERVSHDPLGEEVSHGDDIHVAVSCFSEGTNEAHTQHLPPPLHLDGREFRGSTLALFEGMTQGAVFYLKIKE